MGTPENLGKGASGNVDSITLYLAAHVLRCAGFDAEGIARALKEVYGAEVEPKEVENWLNTVPREIKRKRVLRCFLMLTREKLAPLMYIAGAIVGDGDLHGERGRLRVKDENFAKACAEMLSIVTGRSFTARLEKDGFYCIESRALGIIKRGLWMILAYIDRGERRYFLSGLLDAEASFSPFLARDECHLQLIFGITDAELARFVERTFREIGLKPLSYVRFNRRPSFIDGKTVIQKKPIYIVQADIRPSRVSALEKLVIYCKRKRLLVDFFLAVKDLDAESRRTLFLRYFRKDDKSKRWMPTEQEIDLAKIASELKTKLREWHPLLDPLKYSWLMKRLPLIDVREPVECLCGKTGVFIRYVIRYASRDEVRLCVYHENRDCEILSLRGSRVKRRYRCPKCGEPAQLYIACIGSNLHVRMRHLVGNSEKWCPLLKLRVKPDQPHPTHQKEE